MTYITSAPTPPGVGLRVVPGRATSHRAIVVNSIEATHYGHCRPSRQDVSRPMGCVWRCRRVRRRSAGRAHGDGEGWHPAAAPGAQAAAGRSDAAQGGDGDLVCLFLRYAVAGHRTALRSLLQHALWIIRPLDPARPLATVAQPARPPPG